MMHWRSRAGADLFLASVLALYAELVVIRWMTSEIRVFAYFKNLPLMAAFLGLGLGCVHGRTGRLAAMLPALLLTQCTVIAYAQPLRLIHLHFPDETILLWGLEATLSLAESVWFLVTVIVVFGIETASFAAIGQRVGALLARLPPLAGYSINVAGSLAGIVLFSWLSVSEVGPVLWVAVLVGLVLWFDRRRRAVALSVLTLVAVALAPAADHWSPYYRIDFRPLVARPDASSPEVVYGHSLSVNHDYHQRVLDLSEAFVRAHPGIAREKGILLARSCYDMPFVLASVKDRVLVVGAGTGNDVAAALRAGAGHVDAVEIDPTILALGRTHHPERPYGSGRVRTVVADARRWFRLSGRGYDLVVFGLLDSHTTFSSLSSLRLDDYVYTVESIREAYGLLSPRGVLTVAFAVKDRHWLGERLWNTLVDATGQTPVAFLHGYDAGVTFAVGPGLARERLGSVGAIEPWRPPPRQGPPVRPATDDWPFLYIRPGGRFVAYGVVLATIVMGAWLSIRLAVGGGLRGGLRHGDGTMFLLGVAFMLVEVRGLAELSLLYGSTWVVNSAVFAGILVMVLAANGLVAWLRPVALERWYLALAVALAAPLAVPVALVGGLASPWREVVGTVLATCPMAFSGIIFATCFARTSHAPSSLAANLFGSLVGAVVEYASMFTGIRSLTLMAMAAYALSYAAVRAGQAQTTGQSPPPSAPPGNGGGSGGPTAPRRGPGRSPACLLSAVHEK